VSDEFLDLQDRYLAAKTLERGVVPVAGLAYRDSMALWQGDITRLDADAIVNAGNPALLGCFQPLHDCIDNVIHSNAGVQARLDCQRIMGGAELPNGEVVATPAYNLPSRFIFHTVGPIVSNGRPTERQAADLAKCYRSCLGKAAEMGLDTLALCCLSTGLYGYPKEQAARLATATVRELLPGLGGLKVIFTVYLEEDKALYEHELSA